MTRARRAAVNFFLVFLAAHLHLSATTNADFGADDESEGLDFRVDIVSPQQLARSHHVNGMVSPDMFQYYLPPGKSCLSHSAAEQQPAEAAVGIPVQISLPSRLFRIIPGLYTRPFQLKIQYASDEQRHLLHETLDFNLENAVVNEGLSWADLNVTAQLQLPCGSYATRVIVADGASGTSLAVSQEMGFVVSASSYKYNFCYLVQAPSFFNTDHLTQSESSFAMVLQWKVEHQQPHSVFLPNSTWNQGRSALFAAAKLHRCLYYIFVDDDAELVHREWDGDGHSLSKPEHVGDTWREFERLLLAWQPAAAVPHAQWHRTNNQHTSAAETIALFDHMILAVRSSAVDCMLPYEVRWDQDSLDYSVIPSYIISRLLFPDLVLQFKSLSAINKVLPRAAEFLFYVFALFAASFVQALADASSGITQLAARHPVIHAPAHVDSGSLSAQRTAVRAAINLVLPASKHVQLQSVADKISRRTFAMVFHRDGGKRNSQLPRETFRYFTSIRCCCFMICCAERWMLQK
jgi:hypothetical protein